MTSLLIEDLKIDYVDVNDLKPHPKNSHKHSDEQIERLCKIVEYNKFRTPLTLDRKTKTIVCGHGRLMAAKKLGIKKVPVVYQDFESEDHIYAHLVADNAIGKDGWANLDLGMINQEILEMGPDFDVDLLGIKDFVIEPIEKYDEEKEDDVPEVRHDPITKRGDVWLLGNHRVMCGDSTMIDDVEKLMNGEKADMVFTDPPYGINRGGQQETFTKNKKHKRKHFKQKDWDKNIPPCDFFQTMLGLNLPSIVFGGNYMTEFLPPSMGWIYWDKGQAGQLSMSDGELAWTNQQKALRSVKVNRSAIGKSVHPTQKPIQVVEFCLNYIDDAKSVIDFFLGSGSTLIACEKTNRKCYGMELDEHYCDVIINRWQEYTCKKATLESNGKTYDELKECLNE